MARIRSIKPEFFKNEELALLPPRTRLLFIGLWGLADKSGRLEDRPNRIKAEIFPYETIKIDKFIQTLHDAGFIQRYEVGKTKYILIINFEKHQRITGKEAESRSNIPSPGETIGKHPGNTCEAPGITGREGKGKEGKEGCGEGSTANGLSSLSLSAPTAPARNTPSATVVESLPAPIASVVPRVTKKIPRLSRAISQKKKVAEIEKLRKWSSENGP